mmetsp:Transcript_52842/g.115965  ORF Transcript_52842/g.115965 Transcript_52842/m.115965 type:complete len:243 (-) Transcript_52842:755-1483(-)
MQKKPLPEGLLQVLLAPRQIRAQALVLFLLLLLSALHLVDFGFQISLDGQPVTDVTPQAVGGGPGNFLQLESVLDGVVLLGLHTLDFIVEVVNLTDKIILVSLGLGEQLLQLTHLRRVPHLPLHEALRHHTLTLLAVHAVLLVAGHVQLQQVNVLSNLTKEAGVLGIGKIALALQQLQGHLIAADVPRAPLRSALVEVLVGELLGGRSGLRGALRRAAASTPGAAHVARVSDEASPCLGQWA